MPTSASLLVASCLRDEFELPIPVLADYFNIKSTEEELYLTWCVYLGLVKYKGVSADLLHKCFLANRLDELIHKKFRYNKTCYYKMFAEKNLQIGQTNLLDSIDHSFPIFDDNHCPYCISPGYLTNNNSLDMDCEKCFQFMCKKCVDKTNCLHEKCT